ncbi:MAG: cysteine--tRNA ligase, partial [Bacteroidetes bacterium]|nr:cysteine--tRNA ligase [Bacteroidota bacterium]
INKGLAYEKNGSVYFDVLTYAEHEPYGELSGRKLEDLIHNTRELDGQEDKKNSLDFALWKRAEPEHIMKWNSPWGMGFPGWHLECSVMSRKYLGDTFDIHGGGMDLKFPHHECEIAQHKGAIGMKPVNYWLHTNMLTVNGRKMSKSEGNGFTPEELLTGDHKLLDKGYSAMAVRFFMLMGHYSSTLDFSNTALQAAEKAHQRMMTGWKDLLDIKASDSNEVDVDALRKRCQEAMNDDFNTPVLIGVLFDAVKAVNLVKAGQQTIDEYSKKGLTQLMYDYLFTVMGLREEGSAGTDASLEEGLIQMLIAMRKEARVNKDFALSDGIRDRLAELHVQLKDGPEGTSWSKG